MSPIFISGMVALVIFFLGFLVWLGRKAGIAEFQRKENERQRLTDEQKTKLIEEIRTIAQKKNEERARGTGPFDADADELRKLAERFQVATGQSPGAPKA